MSYEGFRNAVLYGVLAVASVAGYEAHGQTTNSNLVLRVARTNVLGQDSIRLSFMTGSSKNYVLESNTNNLAADKWKPITTITGNGFEWSNVRAIRKSSPLEALRLREQ